jgi:hypothetical protein
VAEELSYRPRDGELETDGHPRHDIPVDDLMTTLTISPLRVSSDVLRVSLRSVAARDVVLWCAARMALVDRCALLGCLVHALARTPPVELPPSPLRREWLRGCAAMESAPMPPSTVA